MKELSSPFQLGDLTLANRLVMAPMTRNRADEQGAPTDVMATYYGYDKNSAQASVRTGHADLVAFGTPFLANPDLVDRFRRDLPLNVPDHETFYGGDQCGYIDYPAITAFAAGAKS